MTTTSEPQSAGLGKELDEKVSKESFDGASDHEPSAPTSPTSPDEEKATPLSKQNTPEPPPNGGAMAWLQVLGAWMLFFNTWGILNTFGIFQTYYESGARWTASSSNISWIGTIQAFMVMVMGVISGPIYDRGYFKTLLIVGSFLIVLGFEMLSLCKNFWETLLAQGFCVGIGSGLLFIPGVALLPTYFTTKLGLAIGLAASGSSTGGIIYPIMFYKLIDKVGFGWTCRILGFTALATLLIPIFCMKMRVKPGRVRKLLDPSAFTDLPFMLFTFGCIVGFIGLYVGLFYTSFYGEQTKITDESLSFYLVPILNAASVFGRTLPNWLSDKIGGLNVIGPGALIVAIVLLCYMAVTNVGGMVVVTLFFGFFSGVFVAMPPVLFVQLTKDKSKIGTRVGMGFAMISIGVLCGGPGGGAILGTGVHNLHWTSTWTYGGVCGMAGAATFFALRLLKGGPKLMVKV